MLHSFLIEIIPIKTAVVLESDVRSKFDRVISEAGGEKLASQALKARKVKRRVKIKAKARTAGLRIQIPEDDLSSDKIVSHHRFDGGLDKDVLLSQLLEAARSFGEARIRIRYHVCGHDERKPCQKWQTLVDEE